MEELINDLTIINRIENVRKAIRAVTKDQKAHYGKSTSLTGILKKINRELEKQNLAMTTEVLHQYEDTFSVVINIFDLLTGYSMKFEYATKASTEKDATQAWRAMCTYTRRYGLAMLFKLITAHENDPAIVDGGDEDEDWLYNEALPKIMAVKPTSVAATARNWADGLLDKATICEVMGWQ